MNSLCFVIYFTKRNQDGETAHFVASASIVDVLLQRTLMIYLTVEEFNVSLA